MRRPPTTVLGIAAMAVAMCAAAVLPASDGGEGGRLWYLACTGEGGGDGSREEPFGRVEDAVSYAAAGDSIVVVPVDEQAPECVVELAPGQRLVGADRTPRSRVTRVVTAPGTVVVGLDVVGSEREAINIASGEVTVRDVVIRDAAMGVFVNGDELRVVMERVTIDGSPADAVRIQSGGRGTTDVSLRACTVTGSSRDGLEVIAEGDAAVVMEVVGSRFEDIAGRACRLSMEGEASVDVTIRGVEMSGVGFGVTALVGGGASLDLEVDRLVAVGVEATGIDVMLDASNPKARVAADISGGRIAKSGGSGHGVRVLASGSGTMSARIGGLIVDGGVEYDRGISAEAREGDGRLDLALVGNRVEVGPAALEGIMVRARDGETVCAELRDNTVAGGSSDLRVVVDEGARLELVAPAEADADADRVAAVVRAANPAVEVVDVTSEGPIHLVTRCRSGEETDGG